MDWYVKNPDWWGDVSGALLPHPRMLTMPGVEKYYDGSDNVTGTASNGDVNHSNQNRMVVVPATRNNVSPQKASLKFLIYGGAGWIGGLIGNICEKQGIPFEYGTARLDDRSQI